MAVHESPRRYNRPQEYTQLESEPGKNAAELQVHLQRKSSEQQHNFLPEATFDLSEGVHWEYDGRDRVVWKSIFLFGNLLVS